MVVNLTVPAVWSMAVVWIVCDAVLAQGLTDDIEPARKRRIAEGLFGSPPRFRSLCFGQCGARARDRTTGLLHGFASQIAEDQIDLVGVRQIRRNLTESYWSRTDERQVPQFAQRLKVLDRHEQRSCRAAIARSRPSTQLPF